MAAPFTPSLTNLQRDIEALLKSEGKRTKNAFGQEVFHGYDDALERMFRTYLERGAHAPLVAELRKWNSEWSIDARIEELTTRLEQVPDWPLLRELWMAIVAKRRAHYNSARTTSRRSPASIPPAQLAQIATLLQEVIARVTAMATTHGATDDVAMLAAMSANVARGAKA